MRFSPSAFVVFVAFCALLMMALSSGSATMHIAEAVVTVIIVAGFGGYTLRRSHRLR
jgi:hypothetical protein